MRDSVLQFSVATYVYLWQIFTSRLKPGVNVYDRDWDVLIILDACRVDALREVQREYDFISDVNSIISAGSTSVEWMHNTFIDKHIEKIQSTSYVTANGFATQFESKNVNRLNTSETKNTIYQESDLAKKTIRNETVGDSFSTLNLVNGATINESSDEKHYHPDLITASAIESARQENPEYLIVHYMQPHAPYISEALDRGHYLDYEQTPFSYLKNGGDREIVWESYIDNLRLVLDNVGLLLRNIDANKVRITADHGELFGKLGIYSHIYGVPIPSLRRVPWVKTTANDSQTVDPNELISDHNTIKSNETMKDRLENLGYL